MNYLFLFLLGGTMFTLIKYLSTHFDTKYSSMVAAFPIGLLTSLIISNKKIYEYSEDYSINILILFIASILQIILLFFHFNRYLSLFLAILFWCILNYLNIKLL